MALLVLSAWYLWAALKRKNLANRRLLWALVAASPLGFIALEAGWTVTEVGRQPWIIYQVMRTADAGHTGARVDDLADRYPAALLGPGSGAGGAAASGAPYGLRGDTRTQSAGHYWFGLELELLVGGAMLLVLTAYVVLAGADFGAGVWDLLATGPRKDEQRHVIAKAIGPVWEANHVWLIFLAVILFTAFPPRSLPSPSPSSCRFTLCCSALCCAVPPLSSGRTTMWCGRRGAPGPPSLPSRA